MDESSNVTRLKDVLGFKLSRRKFENGRLEVWKKGNEYEKCMCDGHLCG